MQLSVVVCIVDGGAQLDRCLTALSTQRDAPPLDVIVPWDDGVPGVDAFKASYPQFRFPALGAVRTAQSPDSHGGLHELYDRRRTAGLHLAVGDLVGLLEDRSVPDSGWAAAAVALHAAHANGAIGGALADDRTTHLGHADFQCDFSRYQLPFESGPRPLISYVNVVYKRSALEQTRHVWRETFHDLKVHHALEALGDSLWLAAELVVRQQRGDGERLAVLLAERFAWGKRFAKHRMDGASPARRLRHALQSPLVPLVLWWRVLRNQRSAGALMRAGVGTPAMLLIFGAWGLGELAGALGDSW